MSQDVRRDDEANTLKRARILGLQYIDTSQIQNKQLYKELLSIEQLYQLRVIPLRFDEHNILFGVTNTTSQQTMAELRRHYLDQRVAFALISDVGFKEYMALYDPPKQVVYHDISIGGAGSEELLARVSAVLEQVRADDMLAYLVEQAHRLGASDIHIETEPDHARIRFRIDGVLHSIARVSTDKYRILISAIASAGNVSTSSAEPQQGHIAQHLRMADGNEVDINLRLETVPTINSMDVVMRLFNLDQSMYTIDKLGLGEKDRKIVDDIISRPSGLVMVVGPTGSGKTTTLYSILNSLNTDERKIITVEDPVEYQFTGITQISVNSKSGQETNFADNLRAVLRLDPDIVMVGEIRDLDTAKTALQASLTGHLVLATFHASSTAAALTRLSDIVQQNPLFLSAIRLISAQRLVRRLDDATKQPYEPDERMRARIQQIIDSLPASVDKPNLAELQLYSPGSSEQNPYGYSGQIAIREQMTMSDTIRELFNHDKYLTAQEIEAAAMRGGMVTMLQDGILKVCQGITTIEEVFRVVG